MMLTLSKSMRMSDFEDLKPELELVDKVLEMLNGGDKAQHPLRRWEYAMALKAFHTWIRDGFKTYRIADHGCCTGMLAPMMYWLGYDVNLYEIWAWGNQQEFATRQMELMPRRSESAAYRWINRPLNQLLDEDRNMDVTFCISTIEHIHNHEIAFRDLCKTVGEKGMLFITSDFGPRPGWGFVADGVRPDGMFCSHMYQQMAKIGVEEGFEFLGGEPDWSWDDGCRLTNDYGFASLAMERK